MGVCDVVRLLWSKADVYDLVHSRYSTIFDTGYLRFGPIYSDLVIRVTRLLSVNFHEKYNYHFIPRK